MTKIDSELMRLWDRVVCAVLGHAEPAIEFDLSDGAQVVRCRRCWVELEDS